MGATPKAPKARVLGAVSILLGIILIGWGIERVLRNDYTGPMGWFGIFLAPGQIFVGTVLLFIPLYWRLSRSSDSPPPENH